MAEIIILKCCSKCQETKPIAAFHRNCSRSDGFAHQCKDCFREIMKAYQATALGKATQKRHAKSDKGKARTKRHSQTEKGKASRLRSVRKYDAQHPRELKARWRINVLVQSGRIPRAKTLRCEECNGPAAIYHHHNGYDAAHIEDVIPVCRQCHTDLHSKVSPCRTS